MVFWSEGCLSEVFCESELWCRNDFSHHLTSNLCLFSLSKESLSHEHCMLWTHQNGAQNFAPQLCTQASSPCTRYRFSSRDPCVTMNWLSAETQPPAGRHMGQGSALCSRAKTRIKNNLKKMSLQFTAQDHRVVWSLHPCYHRNLWSCITCRIVHAIMHVKLVLT